MTAIEWVAAELRARGMRDRDLGDAMGWSSGQTSKILAGTRELKADELISILSWLGVPSPIGEDSREAAAARHLASLRPSQTEALLALLLELRRTPEA